MRAIDNLDLFTNGITITVEYNSEYYDKTITCSNGVTTYTATTTSSGQTTFMVTESGTWTITCDGDSASITVATSHTLSMVPDGKTVLPTDDIQIWLACAGIADKSYTTLAEVLADTTTLAALVASENAVDYMVRSTTWAVSVAIVPTMTSNTTPSGEVIYSSYRGSDYAPWKAFDGNNSTVWQCYGIQAPQYIGYHSTQKFKAGYIRYRINGLRNQSGKIQGSNDGSTWVDLTEEVSFNQPSTNWYTENLTKNIDNYDRYRIYLTSIENKDGSNRYADFYEIQFYTEVGVTENATAMSYIGLNNYCSNTLLADSTWCNAICNSEYFESVLNVKVPVMTSATTPSGICSASNYRSGNEAYKAFDNTDNTLWFESSSNSISNAWVEYDFPNVEHIYFVKIYGNQLSVEGASPSTTANVVIQSFDGSSWNNISEVVAIRTPNGSGTSTTPYSSDLLVNETNSKYRILFYQKSISCRCGLLELQFYGREDV